METNLPLLGVGVATALGIVIPIMWARARARHYIDFDALADVYVDAGKPFTLTAPAGGPLDLMLRTGVSYRGDPPGVSVWIEAGRPAPADSIGGYRDHAGGFELVRVFLLGPGVPPHPDAPTEVPSTTHGVTRLDGIEYATVVLARIPAGGALTIQGRLLLHGSTSLHGATLFVKPAR